MRTATIITSQGHVIHTQSLATFIIASPGFFETSPALPKKLELQTTSQCLMRICRSDVLQLATVLTPNQFEAEQLTGRPIGSQQDALHACQTLLERGPKTVVSNSSLTLYAN